MKNFLLDSRYTNLPEEHIHRNYVCPSPRGTEHWKGMATRATSVRADRRVTVRIGDNARRCVVFFGISAPEDKIEYGGTGFLVDWVEGDLHWPYLVTARHVAALNHHESFFIRANLLGGEASLLEIEHVRWVVPEDESVDVAVVPFGLNIQMMDHAHIPLPEHLAQFEKQYAICCGDAINIVGLFRLHHGNKRAIPFVHSGWIAVLPDPNERVPVKNHTTGKTLECEVFLVEAQTLSGLSGSPVFMHEEIALTIGKPLNEHGARPIIRGLVKLLGLYQGSWDGDPGEILAKDRGFSGQIRVPVGMGVVVPANKITDLIKNHPGLKEDRRARGEAYRVKRAGVADSAITPPLASEANPKHREDFNSLLNAAARKPEPKD
jgi:hypothetical protein